MKRNVNGRLTKAEAKAGVEDVVYRMVWPNEEYTPAPNEVVIQLVWEEGEK